MNTGDEPKKGRIAGLETCMERQARLGHAIARVRRDRTSRRAFLCEPEDQAARRV